jgi:hypothetical protein
MSSQSAETTRPIKKHWNLSFDKFSIEEFDVEKRASTGSSSMASDNGIRTDKAGDSEGSTEDIKITSGDVTQDGAMTARKSDVLHGGRLYAVQLR